MLSVNEVSYPGGGSNLPEPSQTCMNLKKSYQSDDDISFSSAPEAPTTDADSLSVSDPTKYDNFKQDILSNPDIQGFQAIEPSDVCDNMRPSTVLRNPTYLKDYETNYSDSLSD
ncbi:unnamed protein product [Ceutorhynchus assimilis]|uniref:Uncharacterized protein n=1 Tax=Ceutorhynchus assimilis TaxID=467358 RepID=A0A9N9MU56_9CUCU|nr:unnamed protein product [Ceutorhynchus assimilis]